MEIENISLADLKSDIETLNNKYDIYINIYDYESQVRRKFINHYSKTHQNIEISFNSEFEKKLKHCNTYNEYKEVFDEYFGDTTQKRLDQLIDKFSISEQKYFKQSIYYISKNENVENDLRSKIKTSVITFKQFVTDESYRVSDRAEWEKNFMSLMNILFNYPEFEPSYDTHSLADLTEHINKSQNNYYVKFYKNHNVDITIYNQEDFNKFKEIYIADFMESIKRINY